MSCLFPRWLLLAMWIILKGVRKAELCLYGLKHFGSFIQVSILSSSHLNATNPCEMKINSCPKNAYSSTRNTKWSGFYEEAATLEIQAYILVVLEIQIIQTTRVECPYPPAWLNNFEWGRAPVNVAQHSNGHSIPHHWRCIYFLEWLGKISALTTICIGACSWICC